MRAGVHQERQELAVFEKRTGPPMSEYEWQRIRAYARCVQEVDLLFTNPRGHVGHHAKSSLEVREFEGLPIGDQVLEPCRGRSELPPLVWRMRHAAAGEPVRQLLYRHVGDRGRHLLNFDAIWAHAHSMPQAAGQDPSRIAKERMRRCWSRRSRPGVVSRRKGRVGAAFEPRRDSRALYYRGGRSGRAGTG